MVPHPGLVHDLAGIILDPVIFGIHLVLAQVFHLDGAEGTKAGMEGYFGEPDPFDLEALDKFPAKVQTGGGGCYRAFELGVYGLVAFFIFFVGFAFDVFGERGLTKGFQDVPELVVAPFKEETDGPAPGGGIVDDFRYQLVIVSKVEFVPYADLAGGVDDDVPKAVGFIQFAQEEDFDLGACLLFAAIHSCGENFGIVDDENVLVVKIVHNVFKTPVLDIPGLSFYDHEATLVSLLGRMLGNKV